jgi:hypothetical protein
MTPWAAAAGLRRGDRPVAYGGIPLTGNLKSDNEIWAQLPRGEYVEVRVERAGKEIALKIPCRDDRDAWQARVAEYRAISEGRWQDCIDAISRTTRINGYSYSGAQYKAILCMGEKAKAEKQRVPDEFWRRVHAWATKLIDESRVLEGPKLQ